MTGKKHPPTTRCFQTIKKKPLKLSNWMCNLEIEMHLNLKYLVHLIRGKQTECHSAK